MDNDISSQEILTRLISLEPTVRKICEISGLPGASVGIMHQNEIIYTTGFGLRDVEHELPADAETIYHIASLSKALTCSCVQMFVAEGSINLGQEVKKALPDFTHYDPVVESQATLEDFLLHRVGLTFAGSVWDEDHQDTLVRIDQYYPFLAHVPLVAPLRTKFTYTNWGYVLASLLMEKVSGMKLADILRERLFEPLKMKSTGTNRYPTGNNVASWYQTLPDGSVVSHAAPSYYIPGLHEGSTGITTNVKDLLVYYKAFLSARKDQTETGENTTPGSPLKRLARLFDDTMPVDPDSDYRQSYACGWIMSELPCPLGTVGINPRFGFTMPVVGKGSKKQTLLHHNGACIGAMSSVHVLPDSDTAIVVLTNSLANNDCSDWLGQLFLEAILDNPDKNDYEKIAQESADLFRSQHPRMRAELERDRIPNTKPRPFDGYVGKYYTESELFYIDVRLEKGKLMLRFQGRDDQIHELRHYHNDTFTWYMTAEECVRKARWPWLHAQYWLMHFKWDEQGEVSLRWMHDELFPAREVFRKKPEGIISTIWETVWGKIRDELTRDGLL